MFWSIKNRLPDDYLAPFAPALRPLAPGVRPPGAPHLAEEAGRAPPAHDLTSTSWLRMSGSSMSSRHRSPTARSCARALGAVGASGDAGRRTRKVVQVSGGSARRRRLQKRRPRLCGPGAFPTRGTSRRSAWRRRSSPNPKRRHARRPPRRRRSCAPSTWLTTFDDPDGIGEVGGARPLVALAAEGTTASRIAEVLRVPA